MTFYNLQGVLLAILHGYLFLMFNKEFTVVMHYNINHEICIYLDFNSLSLIKSLSFDCQMKWIADKLSGKFKWVALYKLNILSSFNKEYQTYISHILVNGWDTLNILIFLYLSHDMQWKSYTVHFYHNVLNVL